MNVPTFSYDKVVDKEGNWSLIWLQIITQLLQQLQSNFSNEGVVIPSQTSSNIAIISADYPDGTIFYNSSLGQWQGIQGGSVVTFTVT
jgi:hypothetical protein